MTFLRQWKRALAAWNWLPRRQDGQIRMRLGRLSLTLDVSQSDAEAALRQSGRVAKEAVPEPADSPMSQRDFRACLKALPQDDRDTVATLAALRHQAFLRGLGCMLGFWPDPRAYLRLLPPETAEERLGAVWKRVGDHIRRATGDHR